MGCQRLTGTGALAALKAQGRTDVGVVGIDGLEESLNEIQKGSGKGGYIATNMSKGSIQGGIGLAVAYNAVIGNSDPEEEPSLHRAFYLETDIITKDNVDDALNAPLVADMDFEDPFAVAYEPVFGE